MLKSLRLAMLGTFLSATVVAQGPIPRSGVIGPDSSISALSRSTGESAQSLISGTAVDTNYAPLANASIRLRNLQDNLIEQVTSSNQIGEFTFIAQPNVPYVVEIANEAGRILAVGDVVMTQAGDVAGTLIAIPSRLPAVAGLFGESAGSVLTAATGTGVTVVETGIMPLVSPER